MLSFLGSGYRIPTLTLLRRSPFKARPASSFPRWDTCRRAQHLRDICVRYNILWIADEVQTGLARTERRLAVDHEKVRLDMIVLGKVSSATFPPSHILFVSVFLSVDFALFLLFSVFVCLSLLSFSLSFSLPVFLSLRFPLRLSHLSLCRFRFFSLLCCVFPSIVHCLSFCLFSSMSLSLSF